MIPVILIIFSLLNLAILITIVYKKEERKDIDKKEHRLWMIYGLATVITDIIPAKKLVKNNKTDRALQKLKVKENIEKEERLYTIHKLSISIVTFWIFMIIALAVNVSEKMESKNVLSSLRRDTVEEKEYQLNVKGENGKEEQVTVNVSKKQYTYNEKMEILKECKNKLLVKILGKNKSPDRVEYDLNLADEIGENKISVTWNISDKNVIDYDGTIGKNISKEGQLVKLTATMTFEKETMDTTFAMQVYPKKNSSSLQNTIQEYIDSNDKYKDNIELPKEIDEKKVSFYMASDEYGAYVMPLGFVIAVLLFFAKDSDLNKQLEKRRKQMMSDYPEIVSKILLYYGAGLSVKSSIERIVLSYETEKRKNRKIYKYAYEELGICLTKMRNGVSESVAINQYGARCGIHSYIKFASILEQNTKRGTKDMTLSLKQELKEALSDKKNNMLKNGGQVSTKLLGPMVLMLIISIAIIMAPAFMSMEF